MEVSSRAIPKIRGIFVWHVTTEPWGINKYISPQNGRKGGFEMTKSRVVMLWYEICWLWMSTSEISFPTPRKKGKMKGSPKFKQKQKKRRWHNCLRMGILSFEPPTSSHPWLDFSNLHRGSTCIEKKRAKQSSIDTGNQTLYNKTSYIRNSTN